MHTATAPRALLQQPVAFQRTPLAEVGALAHPAVPACSNCRLKGLCLPCGLQGGDVERLDGLHFARRRVKEGEPLYHEGVAFRFLYAVRSGTFKSTLMSRDGREHVTAFHMPGEMMGLDGLATGSHASSAIALEDGDICAIPYAQLSALAAANPGMQNLLSRLMSREIVREHTVMLLLANMSAEERLAAFLLNISGRMQARGFSASEFHLRMSRAEIGSYLGMKIETVSRTFSSFQQRGLLEVDKKHVRIVDLAALTQAFGMQVQ